MQFRRASRKLPLWREGRVVCLVEAMVTAAQATWHETAAAAASV